MLVGLGLGLVVAATAATVWLTSARGEPAVWTLGIAAGVPMSLVGILLVARRPGNALGWVLAGSGLSVLTGDLAAYYAAYALVDRAGELPGGTAAAWYGGWFWLIWAFGFLFFVPLLFPSGRPPAGRWRVLFWTGLASLTAAVLGAMFQGQLDLSYEAGFLIDNPVGFLPFADVEDGAGVLLILSMLVHAVLAMASLVVRHRRAIGEERLQMRWVTTAAVVTVVGFVLNGVADAVLGRQFSATLILPSLVPAAIGVAILRYRLYEIDRLISRTVSYALVTAILLGSYLASVVVLQTAVRPLTTGSDLTVALSTLVAAGLFRPVARRVMAFVDRRFDRRRYDAARTVEGFGSRLRDEVDLGRVAGELQRTTTEALRPAGVSLWLRPDAPV